MNKHLSKICICLLLLIAGAFCFLPVGQVEAAYEPGDTINIYNGSTNVKYLNIPPSGVVNARWTYIWYPSPATGQQVKLPAYCVTPNRPGVINHAQPDGYINYTFQEPSDDPKLVGIIANGYPYKGLTELGVDTELQAFYATKMAVWCYLHNSWDINNARVNSSLTGAEATAAANVLAAAKKIYSYGTAWTKMVEPRLTATPDSEWAYNVTIDGQDYKQQIFTVHSDTFVADYTVNVGFADPGAAPDGTIIVDESNNETDTTTMTGSGFDFNGSFKVLYPADSVAGESGSDNLALTANVYNYEARYASCTNPGAYSNNIQEYVIGGDPITNVGITALAKYDANQEVLTPPEGGQDDPPPEDEPEYGLIITKVEAGTTIGLEGAIFEVVSPEGDTIGTYNTGDDGTITIPLDVGGNYTVYERQAPRNYLLSETRAQNVTVSDGDYAEVVFENEPYGSLTITKVDADSGAALAGATVQIRHIASGETQTAITEASGVAHFDELPLGGYEIVEIAPPEGYIMGGETLTAAVNAGRNTSVTLTNQAKPGLRILKYDSQTMATLDGATFEVYRDATLVGTYTTGVMGEILLLDIQPGTYLVQEVATDPQHVVNSTPQQVEIEAGQGIVQLVFLNDLKPGVHLVKLDSQTLQPLVNATFRLAEVGGTYVGEFVTGADGSVDISSLEPGAYTAQEILAPEGYLIDDGLRVFQIEPNEDAVFVFTNTIKPSISVVKYDSNLGQYLPGATFRIAKIEDGSHYLDRITDSAGRIIINGLEPGVYSVQELAAPSGYVLDETEYHVELFPGQVSQLVVENEQKPDLCIIKTDKITGEPIAGTTFTVRKADSSTISTVTTGVNGEAWLEDLDPGVYVVTEQSVPDAYLLDDTPQMITLFPNRTGVVQFQNYPKPGLTVEKIDAITRDPIRGAKFGIWYASNNTMTGELRDLGTYYTDAAGEINLYRLPDGWYRITELEPADGYAIKEPSTQDIYLEGGERQIVTFENTPLNGLIIKKVDADTGRPLSGAKFEVRYLSGVSGAGGMVIGNFTTTTNGTVVVNRLEAGTYVIQETQAPSGYLIDDTPQTVFITENQQSVVMVEFRNTALGGLKILKLDDKTLAPLAGVMFEVTKMNGEFIGQYRTDEDGAIYLPEIESGWYTVIEKKAASGYLLDDRPHEIEVKDNETAVLEITNEKSSAFLIRKLDADSGEGIYGATFILYDRDKNPLGQYTSDQNGYIYIDEGLPEGKYYMREIEAAPGYNLDEELKTFWVEYGGTTEIAWENSGERGQIQVIKKSADLNTINGFPAGTLLEGAVFEVCNKAGDVVDTIVSDRRGRAVSDLLPLGRYTVREIKAPAYYSLNPAEVDAELEFSGQTVKLEMLNSSVFMGAAIQKSGYNQVVPNQYLRYTVNEVANTSSVALESFYWRDTLPVDGIRLEKIVTGTYNHTQNYKVMYKTNLSYDYLVLADNLNTARNYVLYANSATLGLSVNEYVTEIMFVFGLVQPGFSRVEKPIIYGKVLPGLNNGYTFINNADVGGLYNGQWIMANTRWNTSVYNATVTTLPKTGY